MTTLSDKERIQRIIDNVMKVARGDYSVQNELSGNNDDLDALAMGFNMMVDDLKNNVDLQSQNKKIRAINAELNKTKEKAEESDRLKSSFLANMSHEIRSPMNAIMGFTTLLGNPATSSEKAKDFILYIKNAGKQLLRLIDDIIDISKIESNQLKVNFEICDLNELLNQVFEIIKEDKNLKLKPDIRLILSCNFKLDCCFIQTDPVRFKQIFINLLSNSIKFTREGSIELGYSLINEKNANRIKLFVKDTGIGIPEHLHDAVFERFRQVHTDWFQEGTGLGLSITKGLVDLLNGNIQFESEVGKGTVFYIDFPLIKTNVQSKSERTIIEKNRSIDLSEYSIYIAEDRPDSYFFLEEFLSLYKAKIRHAKNGKELMDLISEQLPDLVLLDINMPIMNGFETIKEIRKREFTFPVIAQTAYAMADERTKILNSGCNGCITKPINPDELLDEIKKQLSI